MHLLAQVIGILAMAIIILSFQFKTKRYVLLMQLIGAGLFAVNMFMLDAVMGGILNTIAVFRAAIYMRRNNPKWLNWVFFGLYFVSYLLTFTIFGKAPTLVNFLVEILPLIGMVAMTIAFSKTDTKIIRICGLINSPCWLIYNCINFTIGGILCEAVSLLSIVFAMLRFDTKKDKKEI